MSLDSTPESLGSIGAAIRAATVASVVALPTPRAVLTESAPRTDSSDPLPVDAIVLFPDQTVIASPALGHARTVTDLSLTALDLMLDDALVQDDVARVTETILAQWRAALADPGVRAAGQTTSPAEFVATHPPLAARLSVASHGRELEPSRKSGTPSLGSTIR